MKKNEFIETLFNELDESGKLYNLSIRTIKGGKWEIPHLSIDFKIFSSNVAYTVFNYELEILTKDDEHNDYFIDYYYGEKIDPEEIIAQAREMIKYAQNRNLYLKEVV